MTTFGGKTFQRGVLCAAMAMLIAGPQASAQTKSKPPAPEPEMAQAARTFDFDIASKPLPQAIADFSAVTGIQVLYTEASTYDHEAPALKGAYTARQALNLLLDNSGLAARYTTAGAVTIELPGRDGGGATTLGAITVEGQTVPSQSIIGNLPEEYSGGQVARGGRVGMLGNRDILDTPFSSTSYTAQTIEDQQASRITDVFLNDPTVRTKTPTDGVFDSFYIRGFPVTSVVYTANGLAGSLPTDVVATESVERIEILKGPSALLSGMAPLGAVGGSVNIVPKLATDEPITSITGRFQGVGQGGFHADVGRRFGRDNRAGVRVNAAYRNGDTAIDDQSEELGLFSAGLDLRGDRFRLSFSGGYQHVEVDAPSLAMTVSSSVVIPEPPDADSNPFPSWGFVKHQDIYGAVRGEYDIAENVTAHAAFGAVDHRSLFLNPSLNIDDAAGNTTASPYYEPSKRIMLSTQAGMRGNFQTGSVKHEPSFEVALLKHDTGFAYPSFSGSSSFTSNLYNPISPTAPDLSGVSEKVATTSTEILTGAAVSDVVSVLDERVQLIFGARWQEIEIDRHGNGLNSRDDKLSPGVGLVVKPWQNVSLYGNYIEGLSPGPKAPSGTANVGEVFPPIVTEQFEAGVKVDYGNIAATLSAFQITQPNGVTTAATNTFGVDGEQRNRGVELSVAGQAADRVRLLGGAAFTDAEQVKTANGSNDGKTAVGVPEYQLNLGLEWDTPFLDGFTLGGRATYTSSQFYDAANTQSIPDWWRFDLSARYALDVYDTPIQMRASITNLLDDNYWESTAPSALSRSAPRTFLLSATARF